MQAEELLGTEILVFAFFMHEPGGDETIEGYEV
jgi:hypothetical protein